MANVQSLGARFDPLTGSWRFAVWSRDATAVRVVVADRKSPAQVVVERELARHGDVWSAEVSRREIGDADLYGFRAEGPWAPLRGDRFDDSKLLLDPYARDVWFPPGLDRDAAREHGVDTIGRSPWGVLGPSTSVAPRLVRPDVDAVVVAEVHVGAYTKSPTSGVEPSRRGTFLGMIDRLDHLAELGVTAVELLPVHASDPTEGSNWGYMPLAYLAVDPRYGVGDDPAAELGELADACHERGMELWLDVVYNHTTEEDHLGPTYCYRGLGNSAYYALTDTGECIDDAGCGNVFAAGHPVVDDVVLASLDRLHALGVDGFRFDLASVLGRESRRLIDRITDFARERGVRLVAEPWDVVRHQVGPAFPGTSWMQWNDHFRDVVRSFVKGDVGCVAMMEGAVQGSPHLFPDSPWRSVNFVTAHDGFTMRDLVSYQSKRNEPNGHANTDGTDDNRSWNCGWEGDEGAPPDVLELRSRQVRNLYVALLCSAGVPMLLAGDEIARTQGGNNNAYRADDESVWFDWQMAEDSAELTRFVRELVRFRRGHPSLTRREHWGEDVTFMHAGTGHDLGWCVRGSSFHDDDIVVMMNAHWQSCSFTLPRGTWGRVVDTSVIPPSDASPTPIALDGDVYELAPRSSVVLVGRCTP